MKVIVTGYKGYIGRILVTKLIEQGYDILGFDRGIYQDFEFPYRNETQPFKEKLIDIRSISGHDLENYDAIIHLAALSNDPTGELNPDLTEEINFKASVRLAELAKKAAIKRFIFSSSCSVYGKSEKEQLLSENDKIAPITEYAKAKIKFENYLKSVSDVNFKTIIMRNSTVYGYSPSLRMDLVVNNLTGWGYFTHKINILSDGRPWRPLIHVSDLSNIFIKMLELSMDNVQNQTFNVGFNEENYQIKEIAEIISEIIPDTEISTAKSFDSDSRSYKVDFNKLHQTVKITKEWNVKKGAEELYKIFQRGDLTKQSFIDKKYSRLFQLKAYLKKHDLMSISNL